MKISTTKTAVCLCAECGSARQLLFAQAFFATCTRELRGATAFSKRNKRAKTRVAHAILTACLLYFCACDVCTQHPPESTTLGCIWS